MRSCLARRIVLRGSTAERAAWTVGGILIAALGDGPERTELTVTSFPGRQPAKGVEHWLALRSRLEPFYPSAPQDHGAFRLLLTRQALEAYARAPDKLRKRLEAAPPQEGHIEAQLAEVLQRGDGNAYKARMRLAQCEPTGQKAEAEARRFLTPSPEAPPEPEPGAHLDRWFDWYHLRLELGLKTRLADVAAKTGWSVPTIKRLHADYRRKVLKG